MPNKFVPGAAALVLGLASQVAAAADVIRNGNAPDRPILSSVEMAHEEKKDWDFFRRGAEHAAVDPRQPLQRLLRRHVGEELERVVAAKFADGSLGRLEPRRLLVGQATRPDHVDQLWQWSLLDGRPVGRAAGMDPRAAPSRSIHERVCPRRLTRGRGWISPSNLRQENWRDRS